jgi:signal transduction histidine kinase
MINLAAQLQQENDRYAAQCERLSAELAQLRQENERLCQMQMRSQQTPLLSTVAQVANLLLRTPDYTTVLPDVVRLLGEAVGSDRCVVAQCLVHPESGEPAVRVGSEWEYCQQGVLPSDEFSPHTDKLFLWQQDTPFVYEKMRQGEVINALVTDIPEPDCSLFIAQGNTAELFVPISENQKLWGFIAFDNCSEPRLYDEAEIAILKVAAESLAAAIERQAKDEELREAQQALLEAEQARSRSAAERSQELAKANEVLKRTIGKLSEQPELNAFLDHVLAEAAEQVEACSNALFLYDAATHTLSMHAIYLHGQIANILTDPRLEAYRDPIPADSSPAWKSICETGWVVAHETDGTDPNSHPQSPSFHRAMGHETVVAVPLVVGGRAIGFMAPCFQKWIDPNPEKIELVQSLAHQATLALELTRLADEAKQAAIAREQEKAAKEQAAELAKANDVLARASSRLTDQPDLNAFLGHITLEATAQLGANAAHIMLFDEQREVFSTAVLVEKGCIVSASMLAAELPVEQARIHSVMQGVHNLRYVDLETEEHLFWQGSLEYHRQRNHRTVLVVPLNAGRKFLGYLGLAFIDSEPISEQKTELLQALAHQAALAIQLTQLAEEAKQAAIAREQEKAAQERAAELAKANEALKRSLDCLATEPSLDKFLGQVLTAISEQFNSPMAEYWYHPEDIAYVGMMSWQGEIYNREEISTLYPTHPGVAGFKVSPEMINYENLHHRKQYFIIENWLTHPFVKSVKWMPENDLYKEINVPMVLGDNCIGALIVRMSREQEITTQQIELAQSLAHQATLAAQLTRLAEEAKQAAILEERNRFARDIHDTLAQALGGIIVHLQAAASSYTTDPQDKQTHLTQARLLAKQGLTEARRSVQALRPQALEQAPLDRALTALLHQLTDSTNLHTVYQIHGNPYRLPPEVEDHLLRIGQEAIANTLRHAQASELAIDLTYEPRQVQLRLWDNGIGFDPALPTSGYGIMGMQERAHRIAAHLHLSSQPGQGTTILITVPVSPATSDRRLA